MRRQVFTFILIAVVVIALGFWGTKLFLMFRGGQQAGLKVTSIPEASVFVDDEFKSKTPYEEKFSVGTYTVKLTPEGTGLDTASWQQQIELTSGLLTFINRELGPTDLTSAGEILRLEPIEGENSEVSVVSRPDGATAALDGEERGSTPLNIPDVAPGDHTLFVFAPGFKGRQIKINTIEGHKLNADVQLALIEEAEATEEGKLSETEGETVRILDTPTGWLRVREEPTLSATEAAKVDPGKEFPFLDEREGWFQIEYESGKEGWVSSRYSEKLEPPTSEPTE